MDKKKIRNDIDKVNKLAMPMKGRENENGNMVLTEIDISSTINESFGGEEGILEIFKGVYAQAKKGSVPHAAFIMQWYFKGGEGEDIPTEIKVTRRIIK